MSSEQACPVCGHGLEVEPWSGESPSDEICPCCGVQFGYDDAVAQGRAEHSRYRELREAWIGGGMRWWSQSRPAPPGWDPAAQLASLTRR